MQNPRRAHVLASARGAAFRGRPGTAFLGAIAALTLVPAAQAAVKEGRTIEVAHGRDLVIMNGFPATRELVVEVVRKGVVIATTAEQHYKTDADGFLEINHVGGTDCFDNGTAPDIRPGDTVRTTVGDPAESTDIDEMVVKNVTYDGAPVERTVTRTIPAEVDPATGAEITPATTVTEGTGIFEVRGTALHEDGVTPLEGEIEVRLNHPSRAAWDASNRRDWRKTAVAGPDGRYVAEFDTNGSAGDKAAIEGAEMAALWLGSTSELSGFDGPGSPCNPAPNAGMTKVSPRVVNQATETITIEGYAPAEAVVTLGGEPVAVSENGGWTHSLPTTGLADGPFTVTAVIDGVPVSRTLMVDRTAPSAPTASLASGEHALPQTVHLGGEDVRYTTDGSEPTAASLRYTGGISVTSPLTIKAISVDAAGNVSAVRTFSYTAKPVVAVQPTPQPAPQPVVAVQPTPPPAPQVVVVERPVPVVTEVVREAPAPVQPPAVAPAIVAGIDKVAAPKRVSLAKARKGVRLAVTTKAASIRVKVDGGAKVTAARETRAGYALVFKAKRAGTYKITITAPKAAAKVIAIKVR